MTEFNALFLDKDAAGNVTSTCRLIDRTSLSKGNVLIEVAYSDVNYKDALASQPKSGVIPAYPIIPGIDLSGTVIESQDERFHVGDAVLATGYGLGIQHTGGFSQIAQLPGDWLLPLPNGLSLKQAMLLGTAGLTAALAIDALEKRGGLQAKDGHILVTGASGGVGSLALSMLQQAGYQNITALSRKKATATPYLTRLGATDVCTLAEITPDRQRPLEKQRFDFLIDTVGGKQLTTLLPQISYDGAAALCGNAGGIALETTVLPLILRGVSLLGIDSVSISRSRREAIWQRLVTDLSPDFSLLDAVTEISLADVPEAMKNLLSGQMTGRYLVNLRK